MLKKLSNRQGVILAIKLIRKIASGIVLAMGEEN